MTNFNIAALVQLINRYSRNTKAVAVGLKDFLSPTAQDVTIAWEKDDGTDEVWMIPNFKKWSENPTVGNITISHAPTSDGHGVRLADLKTTQMSNLIINGAMDIWQRGTNFSDISSGYTADRFFKTNTGSVVDISKSSEVPVSTGFTSSMHVKHKSGDAGTTIRQVIENGHSLLSYGGIYLSAYVKVVSGSVSLQLADGSTASVPQDGEWYIVEVHATTLGNTSEYPGHTFIDIESTNAEYYITGVQLINSNRYHAYEKRSVALENLLCKRYYQKLDGKTIGTVYASTGHVACQLDFQEMRVPPSVTFESIAISGIGGVNLESVSVQKDGINYLKLDDGTSVGARVYTGDIHLDAEFI